MTPDFDLPPQQRASQYLLASASEILPQLEAGQLTARSLAQFSISICAYIQEDIPLAPASKGRRQASPPPLPRPINRQNMNAVASAALAISYAEATNERLARPRDYGVDWKFELDIANGVINEFFTHYEKVTGRPRNYLRVLDFLQKVPLIPDSEVTLDRSEHASADARAS